MSIKWFGFVLLEPIQNIMKLTPTKFRNGN